jgi:F-type H+-transporting ATPase subunit gamma
MAGLKEIRTRIASVKSTQKITSAMKMVAAARLRKSQDKIIRLRPYANKLDEILASIQKSLEGEIENVLIQDREPNKVLIVLVTSNRGLCGAFNSNAIKLALHLARETYGEQLKNNNLSFYAIGKKGADFLQLKKYLIEEINYEVFEELSFENIAVLAQQFIDQYVEGKFDRIEFVYNQFRNAAIQDVITEKFLPLEISEEEGNTRKFIDYIFEPDQKFLVENLIPKSLKIKMFKIILDSFTAEHGARMTAMHQATDNAIELISELTLYYNQARQAAITKELLDIVGGAEALR